MLEKRNLCGRYPGAHGPWTAIRLGAIVGMVLFSRRTSMCRSILFCGVAVACLVAGCAAVPGGDSSAKGAEAPDPEPSVTNEAVEPALVMNAEDNRPGSRVKCREMLYFGSNVIATRCMSLDAWERYEKMEMERAQAIVRSMQGSAYSNW